MQIGKAIKQLRKAQGLTLEGLCDRSKGELQTSTLSRVERDSQGITIAMLGKIAKALGISTAELVGYAETGSSTTLSIEPARFVPVISAVQAGRWAGCGEYIHPDEAREWVPYHRRYRDGMFALEVVGDSMTAMHGDSFPEGGVVVVNPCQEAHNKSYVVAILEDSGEATFKQFITDSGMKFLKPLNSDYPTLQINGNARIAGVVTDYWRKL